MGKSSEESILVSEMEDYNQSVSSRYSRYPYWNVMLEAEFLQSLANPDDPSANDSCPEIDADKRPLLETPTWSLTILPEIERNLSSQSEVPIANRLKRRLRENQLEVKEKLSLKGKIFNKTEDWDELNLIKRMLGKEDPRRIPSVDNDSEDDLRFDMIDTEEIMPKLTPEPVVRRNMRMRRPSKLSLEIRQKVSEAKSKERTKLDRLDELRTFWKPSKKIVKSKVS